MSAAPGPPLPAKRGEVRRGACRLAAAAEDNRPAPLRTSHRSASLHSLIQRQGGRLARTQATKRSRASSEGRRCRFPQRRRRCDGERRRGPAKFAVRLFGFSVFVRSALWRCRRDCPSGSCSPRYRVRRTPQVLSSPPTAAERLQLLWRRSAAGGNDPALFVAGPHRRRDIGGATFNHGLVALYRRAVPIS